jgi:hypothetical protein
MAPRTLILLPDPAFVSGTTPIQPGYTKQHSPVEMRTWAADLETLYRTIEGDRSLPPGQTRIERVRATPREHLSPHAQRLKDLDRHLFGTDATERIEGTLGDDGRVEVDGGRHRAHYILERGGTPVPVWVTHPDAQALRTYRDACHAEVARRRPELRVPDRGRELAPDIGRIALADAPREASPVVRPHPEAIERERDRGVFRGERGR